MPILRVRRFAGCIHFDFDKEALRNIASQLLDEIATAHNNIPLWMLYITRYTDSICKGNYNVKLSEARANSVKAALVKRGISPDRLTTEGAGPTNAGATNKSMEGRAFNRRVVLVSTER